MERITYKILLMYMEVILNYYLGLRAKIKSFFPGKLYLLKLKKIQIMQNSIMLNSNVILKQNYYY